MTIHPSKDKITIHICASCRDANFDGERDDRPGAKFALALAKKVEDDGLHETFDVKAVKCLAVCNRPCTISISQAGKFTYMFGNLDKDTDLQDVLDFAKTYGESPDGITEWKSRPEVIRKGVIARIPDTNTPHGLVKTPGEPFDL